MRSAPATALSAAWFVLAPGVVGGLLPWLVTDWRPADLGIWWLPARLAGIVLVAAGTLLLLQAFAQFVRDGRGTPMPAAAPEHLVVTGLYRYVRNPMYVAVGAVIAGQLLVLARLELLWYLITVLAACAGFVHGYEEPHLRRRFGARYDEYRRNVPAWLPRRRPWRPASP